MTDTGQVPGEGLPESAGTVEQPGVPHGSYTCLSESTAEDDDLLLLPGAQSPWGNEVAPPAPEPVVETVHEPGPHETGGRDSGSVDLGGVRLPNPAPAQPRRPLHLGPPIPDVSASPVRSLADRGPAGAPVRPSGPPTTGPEYFDAPQLRETAPQGAAPWGAHAQAAVQAPVSAEAPAAETVVPAPQTQDAELPDGARPAAHSASMYGAQPAQAMAFGPESGQVPVGVAAAEGAHVALGQSPADNGHLAAPEGVGGEGQVPLGTGAAEGGAVASGPAVGGPVASGSADGGAVAPGPIAAEGGLVAPGGGVPEGQSVVSGGGASEGQPVVSGGGASEGQPVVSGGGVPDGGAVPPGPIAAEGGPVAPGGVAPESGPVGPGAVPANGAPVASAGDAHDASGAQQGAVPATASEAQEHAVPVPAPEAGHDGAGAASEPAPAPGAGNTPEAGQAAGAVPASGAGSEPMPESAAAPGVAPAPEAGHAAPDAGRVPEAAQAPDGTPVVDGGTPAADGAQAPGSVPFAGTPVAAPPEGAQFAQPVTPGTGQAPEAVAPETAPLAQAPAPEPMQAPEPAAPAAAQDAPAEAEADRPVQSDPAQPLTAEPAQPGDAETAEPTAQHADASAAPGPDASVAPESMLQQPTPEQPSQDRSSPAPHLDPATPEAPSPAAAGIDVQPLAAAVADPAAPAAQDASAPTDQPAPAEAAPEPPAHTAPSDATPADAVDAQPQPDESMGQFVAVDGSVPTTPHLAPTPPHALVLPEAEGQAPEQIATVPAPREGDSEPAQNAEDLDTRAADQEEGNPAPVDEAQPTGPAAPAYDDAEREAVLKVMRERRDIRNGFRSDPIPHEVLLRVLEAAHTAPSVGHSQPWDFVVIRSADTRRSMHELAMRQRDAYAKSLPKGRAKQFKELKIEAILDTPVNIVVTADPTRGGRHTLGRHTQPQMAPYSAALAVENLWLAARAEGLGVGWVSFFDEREMVRALGLPEHLEVIAYLCVGYVDEFPDEPELMQAGWSKRRPLSWVVHEETYGRRALPGEEPHDLLAETVAQIRPLDAKALGEAWERQKRMTKPAGALGMLEIISAQLSGLSRQCPPPIPEPAAVAIFAGDHGVHAQGVTPWPQEVTAQMVANFLGGGAVCNAFAGQVGAEVCVVDVGVATELPATPGLLPRKIRAGTSDMTTGPAMTREEAKQAIEVGIETARDLVAAGNKALLTGEMGIANTTASAALISVYTDTDPAEVTGRGTGINDETLARKTEVVRRAVELHQPDPADPIGVLAAVGGFEHAAMVGLLLGGASLRTPVILDGVSAGAAALVARAIAPEVLAACIAGHRSAEPGHVAALNKLGLRPLVDLDLRLGEGTGALLALPLVQSTARAMHEVATFDSAGVTEK
ncbi:nicotinate-nucleotide--dimethylbenzimidazole phosphoribosyltransferase [Streptomyces sp. NBC_00588]|uniref:nicotinate-nucleotide--dimethylbenzimidazole phosphoribosyltransferase n=1 Tax=Streptomyces sp. NBC_00588 TaxID=2975784 RepID=UPI002E80D156|nr:nicotinate-nucleotide--dimethylbenzimidazole phosphoribosyltransferase [Streptomyces sp. NBC_00588]WUB39629.1 nicotinate-nucleotide--dimethylbenzimidazole phosphoribosyltransferase [Streptomyces sp. NBC_00588]